MRVSRREFMGTAALGGVGLASSSLLGFESALALQPASGTLGERLASAIASFYRPYQSKTVRTPAVTTWAQVDLGSSQPIDTVRLYPFSDPYRAGNGFPLRFRIECSEDATFAARRLIADCSRADQAYPGDRVVGFKAAKAKGRYVRLTATLLRPPQPPLTLLIGGQLPDVFQKFYRESLHGEFLFALSRMEVLSNGVDIAMQRPVQVDPLYGRPEDAQQLTRPPRPQGEGIVTDHPNNVTPASDWKPVAYRARAPLQGVRLREGLFLSAMRNNIRYLLDSFTTDDMLHQFRQRAGKPVPKPTREPNPYWDMLLAGSNAGRFLMGAGITLRWMEHAELRQRMNALVEGIAECRQPNGYIMAYPEDTIFVSERGAYTRAWLTHGLLEAGYAGNARAFELLRGYYDWYNQMPYLPRALRECGYGAQGMVANTRMYFSPVGKPEDVQVLQRYFQENYWLEDLAARRVDAIWQYPYDRPHSYLVTLLEAYLDLYRATGERKYLDAVLGAWELFRENWQNVGGSLSIIENVDCPPKSNSLYEKLGETCGNAFWMLLNQRLHLLNPAEEVYVGEIEKSIYNVILPNQGGSRGIRLHAMLVGKKEEPLCVAYCCEGQGTRVIADFPQYIYSTAEDGVYVNLFEPSSIRWKQGATDLQLEMETAFPNTPGVRLLVRPSSPVQAKIRIRTPAWAAGAMDIEVNGVRAASGTPGSYVVLDRTWSAGDTVSFVLPIAFKLTKYAGVDQVAGRERFALEYGPILMAAVGAADAMLELHNSSNPLDLVSRLQPVKDRPLHFTISGIDSSPTFVPYFEVDEEGFSCMPIITSRA